MKHFRIIIFGLLITVIGYSCSNTPKKQMNKTNVAQETIFSAEDIYKNAVSKVAMIISYKDGIPFSQGSGFFIEKKYIDEYIREDFNYD